jgi:hypothetical protein
VVCALKQVILQLRALIMAADNEHDIFVEIDRGGGTGVFQIAGYRAQNSAEDGAATAENGKG